MIKLKVLLKELNKRHGLVFEYRRPSELSEKDISDFSLNKLTISIEASDSIDRHQMVFVLAAKYLDTPVGMVEYSTYSLDDKPTAHIQDVIVFDKLRRRGIASAMYDFIKKNEKLEIKTFGNVRTEDGIAFRNAYDKAT